MSGGSRLLRHKELISDLSQGSQHLKVSVNAAETLLRTATSASQSNDPSWFWSSAFATSSGPSPSPSNARRKDTSAGNTSSSEVEQVLVCVIGVLEAEKEASLCAPLISALALIVKHNRGNARLSLLALR